MTNEQQVSKAMAADRINKIFSDHIEQAGSDSSLVYSFRTAWNTALQELDELYV
jgi:hypothetical protein